MKITHVLASVLAFASLSFAACERKTVVIVEPPPSDPVARTKTLETTALKVAIDSYERAPTAENAADARKAFAELDGEIAELEGRVARVSGEERAEAAQKLANLTAYRAAETERFAKAQAGRPAVKGVEPVDARSGAEKVEDAARKTGEALKDAARETKEAIKDAVR